MIVRVQEQKTENIHRETLEDSGTGSGEAHRTD